MIDGLTSLRIREAEPEDAQAIAALAGELGFVVGPDQVADGLAALRRAGAPPLLCVSADWIIGCATWHVTPVLHRPAPVGRITMLVVQERWRGRGAGRRLVEAVQARVGSLGCGLLEVTSNLKLERAHRFYELLGFERTSLRFAKPLIGAAVADRQTGEGARGQAL